MKKIILIFCLFILTGGLIYVFSIEKDNDISTLNLQANKNMSLEPVTCRIIEFVYDFSDIKTLTNISSNIAIIKVNKILEEDNYNSRTLASVSILENIKGKTKSREINLYKSGVSIVNSGGKKKPSCKYDVLIEEGKTYLAFINKDIENDTYYIEGFRYGLREVKKVRNKRYIIDNDYDTWEEIDNVMEKIKIVNNY